MLFISFFSLPFTLIEGNFAMVCFRKWETKFAKINSRKNDFHPFCAYKFLRKKFTCSTKINFGEKGFLFYSEKRKLSRKKIPTKINTKTYEKNFINLRNIFFLIKLSILFFNARFLVGIICSVSKIALETAIYIRSDKNYDTFSQFVGQCLISSKCLIFIFLII